MQNSVLLKQKSYTIKEKNYKIRTCWNIVQPNIFFFKSQRCLVQRASRDGVTFYYAGSPRLSLLF